MQTIEQLLKTTIETAMNAVTHDVYGRTVHLTNDLRFHDKETTKEDIPKAVGIPENRAMRRTMRWLTLAGMPAKADLLALTAGSSTVAAASGGRFWLFFFFVRGSKGRRPP